METEVKKITASEFSRINGIPKHTISRYKKRFHWAYSERMYGELVDNDHNKEVAKSLNQKRKDWYKNKPIE
jgi:hypothetical protein